MVNCGSVRLNEADWLNSFVRLVLARILLFPDHWNSQNVRLPREDEMSNSFSTIASRIGASLIPARRSCQKTGTFAPLALAAAACVMFSGSPVQAVPTTDSPTAEKQTCSNVGSIWWSELLAPETEKLTDFYAKVIGWNVKVVDADDPTRPATTPDNRYTIFLGGDEEVAGLMKANHPLAAHSGVGWLTYIEVDDVEETIEKVIASGGTILREAWETENGDEIAVISDPMGNVFGIVTPAEKSSC